MNFKAVFTHMTDSFHWTILINGQSFEYSTGLAHCRAKRDQKDLLVFELPDLGTGGKGYNERSIEMRNKLIKAIYNKSRVSLWDCQQLSQVFLVIPKLDDVLHCLFMESNLGQDSFNDFCSNLGYSNDSISALENYRACQLNGEKLRKALGNEYQNEKSRIEALEL